MHFLSFQFKRAHHRALAFGRNLARPFGQALTPARFDMLYVVFDGAVPPSQIEIRRRLGLSRPTVSRMLKSLREVGWVSRFRSFDKRTWRIELTQIGRALMQAATYAILGTRRMQAVYESFYTYVREPFFAVDELGMNLHRLAHLMGDFSSLWYPTHHPDD